MEMKPSLILTVLASVAVSVCLAYPNTVPATDSVCRDMTPGHGFAPQKSASPCRVTALKDVVRGGSQIQVTVSAVEGSQGFKGYYLQARSEQNGPIGTFTQSEMTKTHSCAGIKSNAAHHVSKDLKKVVPILWRAPAHYNGTVVFVATCVRSFDTFWTQIKSKPVRIQQNQKRNQNHVKKSSGLATISTTYSRHQRFGNPESYIAGDDGGGGGGDGFPSRRPRILTGIKNKNRNKNQPTSTTAESSKNVHENPNHSNNNYGDDDDSNHIQQLEGIDVDIDIAKIVFKNNGAVLEIPRHTPSKTHNEQSATTTTATTTTTNPHHEDSEGTDNSKRQIFTEVKENESSNSNNRNNYFNYYYVTPNSHEFRTEISHPPPPSPTFTPPSSRIAWQSQPPQQPLQNTGKSITKIQQLVSPKISSFTQNKNYDDGRENSAYGHFSPRPIQPPPLSTFQSSAAVASNFNSNSQSNLGSIYPIHILANHKQLNTRLNQNIKPPNSIQDKLEGQVNPWNGQTTQISNGIQQKQNYGSIGNKFYSPSSPTGISDGSGLDYHSLNAGPHNSKFVYPKMESGFRPNTFPIPLNKLKNVQHPHHHQSSRPPLVHVAELVLNLNNNSNRKPTTPIVATGSNSLISNAANSHNFPVPVYKFYPAGNNNNHHNNFVGINNDHDQGRDPEVDGGPPPRLHLNGFGHGHGHGFGLGHLSNGGGLNGLNGGGLNGLNGDEGGEGGVGEGGRGITGLHPQGGIHLPRYGYLIYNAKRGPPFYIIPEEEFQSGTTDQAQPQFSKLNSNLSGFGPAGRLPGLSFISNGLSNNHKHEFERGIDVGSNHENRVIKPRNDNGR